MSIPYISSPNSVTFVADGVPYQVTNDHPKYNIILDLLTDGYTNESMLVQLAKPIVQLQAIVGDDTNGFLLENNQVTAMIDGYKLSLPTNLLNEILRIHEASGSLTPLFNFVTKLAANSDKEVIEQLYGFIQSCGLSLTTDGNFLAYKVINHDFTDIYTGKMDNSPGQVVSMPRFAVEKNPNLTCSRGLHFAAWNYLSKYSRSSEDRIVLLSINPADVVSIPSDYNNMKGRTSKYTVLREVNKPKELETTVIYTDYEDDLDDYDLDDYDLDDYDLDDYDDEETINDVQWISWMEADRAAFDSFDLPSTFDNDDQIEVMTSNGTVLSDLAGHFDWSDEALSPIVAYRIL